MFVFVFMFMFMLMFMFMFMFMLSNKSSATYPLCETPSGDIPRLLFAIISRHHVF